MTTSLSIGQTVFQTLRRFPLTLLCCILFLATSIFSLHALPSVQSAEFYLITIFLGSMWFLVVAIFLEGRPRASRFYGNGISLVAFVALVFYLYCLRGLSDWTWALPLIAVLVLLPVAPFGWRSGSRDQICLFTYQLAQQIFRAVIASAILLGGVFILLASLSALFALTYPSLYLDAFIVTGSLFFSMFVLSGIASNVDFREHERVINFVQLLVTYIVIPLLLVYAAILHWYFVQLIAMQTLPNGIIVYLVSGFSCVGIATYFALDHSQISGNIAITFLRKHFFKLLLVPLVLMIVAIGIRINEYGLTIARYLVIVLWIELCFVTTYSFTKRVDKLSQLTYLSAAGLAFVAAFSLWLF